MGFMSEAIVQIRMKNYAVATKILSAHLNDLGLKQSSRITLMEWIGECFANAGERTKAAAWFENAARSILECSEIPKFDKRQRAIKDIEKAFDAYSSEDDLNGIKRIAVFRHSLREAEWYASNSN